MRTDLLEETTRELLLKFGQGEAKPGSGSAAALGGLIAAHLVVTVIKITLEKDKIVNYRDSERKLKIYKTDIEEKVIPRLEFLFQEDSDKFKIVVNCRDARNEETDAFKKCKLENEHFKALRVATKIPIHIGNLCVSIAEAADFVFNKAFQSARGDSGVALHNAISALEGSIMIADLNMISLPMDDWKIKTRKDLNDLEKELNIAKGLLKSNFNKLHGEALLLEKCQEQVYELAQKAKRSNFKAEFEIEELASNILSLSEDYKNNIWKKNPPKSQLEVINPKKILQKVCGYQVRMFDKNNPEYYLFQNTAGIINQKERSVMLSEEFKNEVQKFTLAHELGHALMHKQTVMHRDIPFDGADPKREDPLEYQADRFAVYLLMPKEAVIAVFQDMFKVSAINFTEDHLNVIFGESSKTKMRQRVKNELGFLRFVASADFVNYNRTNAISKRFGVSISAMAYRLRELGLVKFE